MISFIRKAGGLSQKVRLVKITMVLLFSGWAAWAICETGEEVRLRPPSIILNCRYGRLPVQTGSLYLSGTVSGATAIQRMEIGGQPVALGPDGSFGQFVKLQPGRQRIQLKAWDAYDAAGESIVEVTAEPDSAFPAALKVRLLALRVRQGSAGYEGDFLAACLLEALHETGRFSLLERSQLKDILLEHQLGREQLVSAEALLRLGRLLLAEQVFSFRIDEVSDTITLHCQLLDVGSGEVAWSGQYRCRKEDSEALENLGQGVALDVKCLTSVVQSMILDTSDWPEVLVEGGFGQGIHRGMKACLMQGEANVECGRAEGVYDGFSAFSFSPEAARPEPGDTIWLVGCLGRGRGP